MDSKCHVDIYDTGVVSAVICARESVTYRQTEGRTATTLLTIPENSHSLQLDCKQVTSFKHTQ